MVYLILILLLSNANACYEIVSGNAQLQTTGEHVDYKIDGSSLEDVIQEFEEPHDIKKYSQVLDVNSELLILKWNEEDATKDYVFSLENENSVVVNLIPKTLFKGSLTGQLKDGSVAGTFIFIFLDDNGNFSKESLINCSDIFFGFASQNPFSLNSVSLNNSSSFLNLNGTINQTQNSSFTILANDALIQGNITAKSTDFHTSNTPLLLDLTSLNNLNESLSKFISTPKKPADSFVLQATLDFSGAKGSNINIESNKVEFLSANVTSHSKSTKANFCINSKKFVCDYNSQINLSHVFSARQIIKINAAYCLFKGKLNASNANLLLTTNSLKDISFNQLSSLKTTAIFIEGINEEMTTDLNFYSSASLCEKIRISSNKTIQVTSFLNPYKETHLKAHDFTFKKGAFLSNGTLQQVSNNPVLVPEDVGDLRLILPIHFIDKIDDMDISQNINVIFAIEDTKSWLLINEYPNYNFFIANNLDFKNQPYETFKKAFRGNIYGNNNTIKNVNIVTKPGLFRFGLFEIFAGNLDSLNFENFTINASKQNTVGVLAGQSFHSRISNINLNNINITTAPCCIAGGLIGCYTSNQTQTTQISHIQGNNINITASNYTYVGGLIGSAYKLCMKNCEANINVIGGGGAKFLRKYELKKENIGVGGIFGVADIVDLENILASGHIRSGEFSACGGLAAILYNSKIVKSSFNGNINASHNSFTGGFVGIAKLSEIFSCASRTKIKEFDSKSCKTNTIGGFFAKNEKSKICYCLDSGITSLGENSLSNLTGVFGGVNKGKAANNISTRVVTQKAIAFKDKAFIGTNYSNVDCVIGNIHLNETKPDTILVGNQIDKAKYTPMVKDTLDNINSCILKAKLNRNFLLTEHDIPYLEFEKAKHIVNVGYKIRNPIQFLTMENNDVYILENELDFLGYKIKPNSKISALKLLGNNTSITNFNLTNSNVDKNLVGAFKRMDFLEIRDLFLQAKIQPRKNSTGGLLCADSVSFLVLENCNFENIVIVLKNSYIGALSYLMGDALIANTNVSTNFQTIQYETNIQAYSLAYAIKKLYLDESIISSYNFSKQIKLCQLAYSIGNIKAKNSLSYAPLNSFLYIKPEAITSQKIHFTKAFSSYEYLPKNILSPDDFTQSLEFQPKKFVFLDKPILFNYCPKVIKKPLDFFRMWSFKGKTFILGNDISFKEYNHLFDKIKGKEFSNNLVGNNHTLQDIQLESGSVFGNINEARIKGINLQASITRTSEEPSALLALNVKNSILEEISITGILNVNSTKNIGGLCLKLGPKSTLKHSSVLINSSSYDIPAIAQNIEGSAHSLFLNGNFRYCALKIADSSSIKDFCINEVEKKMQVTPSIKFTSHNFSENYLDIFKLHPHLKKLNNHFNHLVRINFVIPKGLSSSIEAIYIDEEEKGKLVKSEESLFFDEQFLQKSPMICGHVCINGEKKYFIYKYTKGDKEINLKLTHFLTVKASASNFVLKEDLKRILKAYGTLGLKENFPLLVTLNRGSKQILKQKIKSIAAQSNVIRNASLKEQFLFEKNSQITFYGHTLFDCVFYRTSDYNIQKPCYKVNYAYKPIIPRSALDIVKELDTKRYNEVKAHLKFASAILFESSGVLGLLARLSGSEEAQDVIKGITKMISVIVMTNEFLESGEIDDSLLEINNLS